MGNFTAKLEIPSFIPKEQILGKFVFDSQVVCIGLVEDWTYTSDGIIKMVVKVDDGAKNTSTILIPFYSIDRVGQFILLKAKKEEFIKDLKTQTEVKSDKEGKKGDGLKYFDEIDAKKLNQFIKDKKSLATTTKEEKTSETSNKKQ